MSPAGVVVVDAEPGPRLPIVEGSGFATAVIWPGMGATMRSLHRILLAPGSATVALRHPMEAVYYAVRGDGQVSEPGSELSQSLVEGSMVHVEPGTAYTFASGAAGLELIGGPCPADPALYRDLA